MNNSFKKFTGRANKVGLTESEKRDMKTALKSFVLQNPVRNGESGRLIWQERSLLSVFKLQKIPMPALALLVVLALGGGVSYAAEGSLPGDALYPVKVSFNEEVRSAVTISGEAQAHWDARRAERRLEETEELAAKGELSGEVALRLEERFETHAEAFEDRAEDISARQGAESAFEAHSNFEASLNAHEQVLARIAQEREDVREHTTAILREVRARLNKTTEIRTEAEAELSAQAEAGTQAQAEVRASAEGKLTAAENKLESVDRFIKAKKEEVSERVYTEAKAKLSLAQEALRRGKAQLEAETYTRAFASFQESIRRAEEAQVYIASHARLEIRIGENEDSEDEQDQEEQETTEQQENADANADVDIKIETENRSIEIRGEGDVRIDTGL